MNTVTRKKVVEIIRLLEEMADPPGPKPGEMVSVDEIAVHSPAFKDNLSPIQVATLNEAIAILKGYLRVLIMLSQFRITFVAFFSHYPELFGEQDDEGPFEG